MDYGIIFIIILVLIIVAVIIALVYVNRNNTTNILATLPNYRIIAQRSNTYLALKNFDSKLPVPGGLPITYIPNLVPYWAVLVCGGASNSDPLGIWKIETLRQVNNNVSEVQIINTVYNLETPNPSRGFLSNSDQFNSAITPIFTATNLTSIFTLTMIATNTFTLTIRFGNGNNLPIYIDPVNNLMRYSTDLKKSPDVFRLQLI